MKKEQILYWILSLSLTLALAGCPREELPPNDTADDIPAPIVPKKVELRAPDVQDKSPENEARPVMSRKATVTGLAFVPIEVEQAEDGLGNTVDAAAPMAIEISAEAWPVRALDPVLTVGELKFKHYTFPRLNVLRYVVADHRTLPAGAEASVQYGDDAASRVVVTEELGVPR